MQKRSGKTARDLTAVLENRSRWVAVAVRLVGDREAANDVLQIAFLRALSRLSTLRDPEQFVSWFRRVLSNTAVDYIRRTEAYQRALQRFASDSGTEEAELERVEVVCNCMYETFLSLRSAYAGIIRKVDLEGCSLEEAARATGVTATNARVRLHRARRALRSRLAETCGGSPLESCTPVPAISREHLQTRRPTWSRRAWSATVTARSSVRLP